MAPAAARKAIEARQAEWRACLESKGFTFHEELRLEGRLPLIRGRMFRIRGSRYWWKFNHGRTVPDGRIEVHCSGPFTKAGTPIQNATRCFWSDRVSKVARQVLNPKEAGQ